MLWAVSLVAAVLVGVGLTMLVQTMEAGRVGVLQVDPEAEWPEDVWAGDVFKQIVLGGMAWAMGNVEADVTPNIDKAAPKANQLKA